MTPRAESLAAAVVAAAAAVVAASVVAAAAIAAEAVTAAAEQDKDQNDDPPAAAETIVAKTHDFVTSHLIPVTGTGSDAAFPRIAAAPEPAPVPVSALYYVAAGGLVPSPTGKTDRKNYLCIV